MSENLKLDIDTATERPIDANIINIMINIKDSTGDKIETDPNVKPNFYTGRDKFRVNLILNTF